MAFKCLKRGVSLSQALKEEVLCLSEVSSRTAQELQRLHLSLKLQFPAGDKRTFKRFCLTSKAKRHLTIGVISNH